MNGGPDLVHEEDPALVVLVDGGRHRGHGHEVAGYPRHRHVEAGRLGAGGAGVEATASGAGASVF